jgi:hypothetical protein
MERRTALKNMGMALGYTVATPTLISLVQSCKTEAAVSWSPQFFSVEEAGILTKLVDIILPKTDTPSASEMGVDVFIDRFADAVMEKDQQDFLRMSMAKFLDKAKADSGKENMANLKVEDLEAALMTSLKISKEEKVTYLDMINSYHESKENGLETQLDDTVSRYAFADNLRGLAIWGYKTTEYVGEEVLAYLPVPGEYIACGDVQELTNGKDWSL